MRRRAIALLHHPVVDGRGEVVTTAVTNLDVHDLARTARSFGCSDYFVVHPIASQRDLVARIRGHWMEGSGGRRIPDRREALGLLRIVPTLEAAVETLGGPEKVELWVTSAKEVGRSLRFPEARARMEGEGKSVLIVFGTGWGLAPSVMDAADARLEPIRSETGAYNHLSVRAACAIVLDRLLGACESSESISGV